MKQNVVKKFSKPSISNIIQGSLSSSRKSKSIRVSPLESRLNTGCMNSPKNSLSPHRITKINVKAISRYVTKAFANQNHLGNNRNIKTANSSNRSISGEPSNDNKRNSNKNDSHNRILFKRIANEEENIKQEKEGQLYDTRPSSAIESLNKKLYNTSDNDSIIRDRIIEMIKESFKIYSMAPTTTPDFYKIGKQLGNGAFGKVFLATNRLTGLKVAIKTIEKEFITDQRTRRKIFQEVFIMKKLQHRNVIRLLEVFESSRSVMIVLEYAGGGDLLQIIKSRGKLQEIEGKGIFYQIIEAVKACHAMGVIHRDIKLDNILLNSDFTEIKLCDFGVSRFAKAGERVNEQCGTPAYLAPEIIADQGYEPFYVDLWSMGVLLYAMLSATVPFKAKNLSDLHKLILKGKFEIPSYFSANVADLIAKMLNPVPHFRISLDEMKKHPWFNGYTPSEESDDTFNLKKQNENLRRMVCYGFPREYVIQSLNLKDVNHATATYKLLEISE